MGRRWKVKGKEYNENGQLIYNGSYLNCIKWEGKIEEYEEGKIIFEGNYKGGKLDGIFKEYKGGILIIEGIYKDGKKNGEIKEYDYLGNIIFKGEYNNGKKYDGKIYNNKGDLESELTL